MPERRAGLAGLYVIADTGAASGPDLTRRAGLALAGGASLLQYRDKTSATSRRRRDCETLLGLCREHDALFIVNDDVELALAVRADGVHLGRDDGTVEETRRRAGNRLLIGASCYDDLDRAARARNDGADYLAFGSFYPSAIKPDAPRPSPGILTEAKKLSCPLVAIGGITADNAAPLIDAGADMIAVISAVWAAPDTSSACQQLAGLFARRPNLHTV